MGVRVGCARISCDKKTVVSGKLTWRVIASPGISLRALFKIFEDFNGELGKAVTGNGNTISIGG